jgi:hypothetical protein
MENVTEPPRLHNPALTRRPYSALGACGQGGERFFLAFPRPKKRARRVDPHEPEFREFQRRSEDAPRIGNDDAVPEWLTTG